LKLCPFQIYIRGGGNIKLDQQPKILINKCLRQLIKVSKKDKIDYGQTLENLLTAHDKYVQGHGILPTHLVFAWYDDPKRGREIVSWRFWDLSDQSDTNAEKKTAKEVDEFLEKAKEYCKHHKPLTTGVDMEITIFDFLEAKVIDSYLLDTS
jgi:hypothetical protein